VIAVGRVRFHKLHGLGNDFLVVDLRGLPAEDAAALVDPEVVRWLCDRQFGVGGDGVLAVSAPRTAGACATMRVGNADGSEAEMCGNGIRCVAKFLRDADASLGDRLVIDTGAGPLACDVHLGDDGQVDTVTVDMGRPRLTRAEIPATGPGDERWIDGPLTIPGDPAGPRAVTAVSMGNPHAVVFVDDPATVHTLARTVGPSLETHAAFPRKTNAEFAALAGPDTLELGVWERGCGITLACGDRGLRHRGRRVPHRPRPARSRAHRPAARWPAGDHRRRRLQRGRDARPRAPGLRRRGRPGRPRPRRPPVASEPARRRGRSAARERISSRAPRRARCGDQIGLMSGTHFQRQPVSGVQVATESAVQIGTGPHSRGRQKPAASSAGAGAALGVGVGVGGAALGLGEHAARVSAAVKARAKTDVSLFGMARG
jgi:diaminopimelate epimerase